MNFKKYILVTIVIVIFGGCANSSVNEGVYNKSAGYWYNDILKNIRAGNLDKADEAYTSLASEHVASPLLKESLQILAQAHKEGEEYLMSNYYIDEYTKRFAKSNNIEYLKYLKIESNFQAFKKANRDQKLLIDTINSAIEYKRSFPNSTYLPLVETMMTRLQLGELLLNKNIIKLYKKTGKDKAAKIYQDKIDNSWLKNTNVIPPESGLFSSILN